MATVKRSIRNCLRLLLSMLLICNGLGGAATADTKKDVTDPVLQEILTNFSSRMPRFIDKHGASVFVADAPVTRGALMMALYEYDRSLKIPRKDYVSRQEFDELRSRLSVSSAEKPASPEKKTSGQYDMTQIINDLLPNMPILLDNSLEDSKVFAKLKEQVQKERDSAPTDSGAPADTTPARGAVSKKDFDTVRSRLSLLEKDFTKLSEESGRKTAAGEVTKQEFDAAINRLSLIEKDMTQLSDGSGKKPAAGSVTKQEFDSVRNRLSVIEKDIVQLAGASNKADKKTGTGSQVVKQEFDSAMDRISQLEKDVTQLSEASGKKPVAVSQVTKQEFEKVRSRLSLVEENMTQLSEGMEKGTARTIGAVTKQEYEALRDRLSLIEKNMPEHEDRNSPVSSNVWSDIHQSQREIASLARRVDDVERKQANPVQYAEQKPGKNRQPREDNTETRKEISRLSQRMDELEATALQKGSESREAGGYASALTKITLGLGMVAAFFMAR